MNISQEKLKTLKGYGKVLGLEEALRDSRTNQDPTRLSNVSTALGEMVLDDPLMSVRMPTQELALEARQYINGNWETDGTENYRGFNISGIVTENSDEILGMYVSTINDRIGKTAEKAKKATQEKGKEWKGLSKQDVAYLIGMEIMQTLEPEQLREISGKSESEKRNFMYQERSKSRPFLTRNVAFYEDPSQAESLMIRIMGEQFIKEIGPSEEGGAVTYEVDREKLGKYYNVNPMKKNAEGVEELDKDKARENREKYALMVTKMG